MDTGPIAYRPAPETIARANVSKTLARLGLATEDDLVQWSTADVARFWGEMEREIGFRWQKPYTEVLDESKGVMWARWFADGEINIAENCVDRHAESKPHKIAVAWEGEDGEIRRWTYADLSREVNQLAHALTQAGVAKGEAVGVYLPMLPETTAALLAVAKIGAIFVPLFSGFGADAIEKRLKDADAKVLLTADGYLRKGQIVPMKSVADEAVARVPSVTRVIVLKRAGNPVPWTKGRDVWWSDAIIGQPSKLAAARTRSEDPWMVIYTSGTTGQPKGSVHVHGGFLVKIAQEVYHQTDLREGDTLFWFTDMGWIMGPWEVVGTLALGGTLFLFEGSPDYPTPDRLWSVVARHKITILGVSPTLIRSLMKHGDRWPAKHDLSALRVLASTGEPWNPEPWTWLFENVGGRRCPIINLSGGTEVGACFLSPTPLTPLAPCSLGHPAFGMAVDVYDESGKPVPSGTVGELVATRPWPGMTRGLWRDANRFIEAYWSRWPNVWWHGDFASRDAHGYWFLHGRSDDTIKIAGKRVGPAEIESILVDTGFVLESAVVGVPDAVKGEVVHCYAMVRPPYVPSDKLARELADAVEHALGKPFRPKGVHFVSDIPRTRNGKILRRAIRAKATGKDAGDLSSLVNPQALDHVNRI